MELQVANNIDLKFRKIMGRTYLNENHLEDALEVFTSLVRDYPQDVESLIVLGNMYLAGGDGVTAAQIFRRAHELEPGNPAIEQQLLLASTDETPGDPEPVPTDPQAIARLLKKLSGATEDVQEEQIARAVELLQGILQSQRPAEMVANHLEQIDELLPALVEINARQALADGKPELAQALRDLRDNILLQKENAAGEEAPSPAVEELLGGLLSARTFSGRVLFLAPDPENLSERMGLLREALQGMECPVQAAREYSALSVDRPDVVIASNPHVNPRILESMAALSVLKAPLVVDLDDDFEHLPVYHPNYASMGLNTPARGRAHTQALLLANLVTVNSAVQANSLASLGYPVKFIPDGWSNKNPFWAKPAALRSSIHIGWVGSSGQLEDLAQIRRVINRVMREFSNVQLVIIGNAQAYRLFDAIPENRRMFLPALGPSEYPFLLSQVDILVAPLRNDPYHMASSDRVLMEAGARGIPWLASPAPAFKRWQDGGLTCGSLDEWYINLRQLISDVDLRRRFGQAGRESARTREMHHLSSLWLQAFSEVSESQQKG